MKLTEDQGQRVINYILEKSNHRQITCPICGQHEWSVNNLVTEMREFQNGNLVVGGDSSIMPFVSITCNNCGHTLFINAIMSGIISPQVQSEKQVDEAIKK